MRIISGTARGTKLRSSPAPSLRPMLDRVKESLFDILRDGMSGARVLDLFSGSGALGLEALSEDAESCVFVEKDRALVKLIAVNADKCKLADRCEILYADVFELSNRPTPSRGLPAGLVFVDPPYAMVDDPNARARLIGALEELLGLWVRPGAMAVLHHRPIPHAVWPGRFLRECDKRIYGRSQLTFFEMALGGADA